MDRRGWKVHGRSKVSNEQVNILTIRRYADVWFTFLINDLNPCTTPYLNSARRKGYENMEYRSLKVKHRAVSRSQRSSVSVMPLICCCTYFLMAIMEYRYDFENVKWHFCWQIIPWRDDVLIIRIINSPRWHSDGFCYESYMSVVLFNIGWRKNSAQYLIIILFSVYGVFFEFQ